MRDAEADAVMDGLAGIARCPSCGWSDGKWENMSNEPAVGTCGARATVCPVLYFQPNGSWAGVKDQSYNSDSDAWIVWRPPTNVYR